MNESRKIAEQVSTLMPNIIRKIVFEFFQSCDIPQAQLFVLMNLFEKGPRRFTDLVSDLQVSAPTMTGIVDRMEQGSFVKRMPDPNDRRAILVHLTPGGDKVAQKLRAVAVDRWATILDKLSPKDAKSFLKNLERIKDVI